MLDAIDTAILRRLQTEARTSNAEIAREVGLAPSAVFERIKKLETKGIIRGYEARLDPDALDLGLLAFVFVKADERPGAIRTGDHLAKIPGVLEVHHVAGEDCYLAKVRVRNAKELGRLLKDGFGAIPSVTSTRSTVVLDTIFETLALSIDEAPVTSVEGEAR